VRIECHDDGARAAVQGEVQTVTLIDLSIIAGVIVVLVVAARWGDL
jgi:hypothetical protein